MRKPLPLIVVFCCLGLLAGSLAWAGQRDRDLPHRYVPNSLDGRLVETLNPLDGTLWAAWAYRNGTEYDLAIAFRDERGFWSEPTLIGADDGLDQTQPALVTDNWGNVYLAYTEEKPARIMLTWLASGSATWIAPQPCTDRSIQAMYPALRVVGDRLVVAFRSGRSSVILDLPLLSPVFSGSGIEDMPDPVGAHEPVDPPEEGEDEATDPLVPLDEAAGGAWGSTSPR